uniref:Uncharacterized protein n=1 Tax=Arundo donax TaxID=35708 RepID=A0A0A9FVE6_ARUDO
MALAGPNLLSLGVKYAQV